ncbi:Uncharacterised protein [Mycobacteroides abscessus subsp. abscessus]|nr:Uncharacterised protein [Mycobacteroides abscessus subsp. abscessus]SHY65318.1 Uncharacterised protein [Mycobacteroides abscessus subsp. abscessus]
MFAEFGCREAEELVGLGIAARAQVRRQVRGLDGHFVGLAKNGCGVRDFEVAALGRQAVDAVSVFARDLLGLDPPSVQLQRQLFRHFGAG